MLFSKVHGIHVKHNKFTANSSPERIPTPALIRVPTQMHIGAPAVPVVSVGNAVKIGTLIAKGMDGKLSSPIYSGICGIVKKIEEVKTSLGTTTYINIESNGENDIDESVVPPTITGKEDFIEAVRLSGIVGYGGAGFPTYAKFNVPDGKIDTIVVNGAECEPYITSDTQTMLLEADLVIEGLELVMKYINVPKAIIGIEKNKPQCINSIKNAIKNDNITIKPLPALYPQGGEKVLVYNTTGRIIAEGALPLNHGVIVINVTTLASIAKYIKTGMPIVEKCITVDGTSVANRKNVIAQIGTPVKYLFDYCGGFKTEPKQILYGGLMMGNAIPDMEAPVLKQTNAVLALSESEVKIPEITECIKCGTCYRTCPLGLMPFEISRAYKLNKPEELEKLKVNLCMECGCCSYVCPANKELVQQNKLAKGMLRTYQNSKKEVK
ncbi:MAG: electron transport complex subunit RsxC [Clostridia bacterium]|nr:electron transport complex subunit RsxC [Clostridia bacterium]